VFGDERALVVAQPWIDASGATMLRIEREIGGQGECTFIQPLGAERFVSERFAV